MMTRLDAAPATRRVEGFDKEHDGDSSSGPEGTERMVESEDTPGTQPGPVEMLGIVPMPADANRCTAVSKRSGKRCKRYRQAQSSVCSKHASSVTQPMRHRPGSDGSGLGKPIPQAAADTWPWDEEEWRTRFDEVNEWIWNGLHQTNPELTEDLWGFFSRVEDELHPH
ncbi:MAG: hypothetical protein H0U46_00545, partial [Actinobacteria bacterium]|nr:hypothetical protein [Actinomycetota bacterium]